MYARTKCINLLPFMLKLLTTNMTYQISWPLNEWAIKLNENLQKYPLLFHSQSSLQAGLAMKFMMFAEIEKINPQQPANNRNTIV